MAFNIITSDIGRWGTASMKTFLEYGYDIPCVPVLDKAYQLPDTIEELRKNLESTNIEQDNKQE